jgi:pimeloyl-ACP methyl ester carboxylesterase
MMQFARSLMMAALSVLPASTLAATPQDKYADLGGVKIRYIDEGKGAPIVLLHGGTSSLDSWVTSGVVPNLAKDYRVIAFDARGAGKSDKPHDPKAYGKEQARDVVRLLDLLKIERAHIVGFSLGGSTTSLLLTMHPERFLTGTLVAGPGRYPWTAKEEQRVEQEAAEIARDCISRSRLNRQAPAGAKPTEEEIRQRVEECRANPDFDQLSTAASLRGYKEQALTEEQLKSVRVPTLIIVGDLDHTLNDSRNLKRLRPDATLVIIEGVSHTGARGIQKHPQLVAGIREFIKTQR